MRRPRFLLNSLVVVVASSSSQSPWMLIISASVAVRTVARSTIGFMAAYPPRYRNLRRCHRSFPSRSGLEILWATKSKGSKRGGGGSSNAGGGFGSPPPLRKKKVSKETMLKRVQKKYGGTSAREIAAATQDRVDAALRDLPEHMQMATKLYQQLKRWDAHLETLTVLQQAAVPQGELDGAARARVELERLYAEYDFNERDVRNVFQRVTWDASADAKAARSVAGDMPADIRQRIDRACAFVGESVQDSGHCLDVGCGFGVLVPHLKAAGVEPSQIVGVDLSPEMIRNARELHPGVEFVSADFLSHEFTNESFDAVLFCSALHDLPDPVGSLQKAAELLRPGGRLVIVHAQGASHVLKQVHSNPVMVQRGLPDGTELLQLLSQAGFELLAEPAAPNSPLEAEQGYLAVLQKRQ